MLKNQFDKPSRKTNRFNIENKELTNPCPIFRLHSFVDYPTGKYFSNALPVNGSIE